MQYHVHAYACQFLFNDQQLLLFSNDRYFKRLQITIMRIQYFYFSHPSSQNSKYFNVRIHILSPSLTLTPLVALSKFSNM